MAIYARNQFIPDYYKTFMDRDGSTVAIKDKLFEIPKTITDNYNSNDIKYKKGKEKQREKDIKLDLDFQRIIKDTSGELGNLY